MNVARRNHSSCELGDSIYVFCGIIDKCRIINTIEKIQVSLEFKSERSWKLIQPDLSLFPARSDCLSIALNNKEILIFGGYAL